MREVLKLLSAAVLVLGGGYLGMVISSAFSVRERQLKQLNFIITRMGFNIGFLHMNVADAMKGAASIEKGAVSRIFCKAAEEIRSDGIKPAVALERTIRRYREDLCLREEDKKIIQEFAENLGTGDAERETNNIKAACAKLTLAAAEAEAEKERRGKLWRGLGLLGGILTAVILF